jgi:hypothetical protein
MLRNILSLTLILSLILSILALGLPVIPVVAAVEIEIDPISGHVGDGVDVDFTGWDSSSEITYNVFFGSIKVISAISNDSTKHFNIPRTAGGKYKVTLRIGSTNVASETTFTVEPEITVSPRSVQVGDKITIAGTGFLPKKPVTVSFNSVDINAYETDTYGSFTTIFTLPESIYGFNLFTAKDTDNSADDKVAVVPKIMLSSTSLSAGDKITLSGSGFSGSSKITVSLDEIVTNTTAATNSHGTFTDKQIAIPVMTAGIHTLTVKDANDHSTSVTINTTQSVFLNPQSGPADTEITITGGGFSPNKPISIKYKGTDIATLPASVSTDSNGSFSATIKSPKYAAGVYSISVIQGALLTNTSFTQTSIANVDITKGAVGSSVTAGGSGFNAGAKIDVKYDGVNLAAARADTGGSFSVSFKVPTGQAGEHKITITDSINSFSINFTATAAASLDPATGNIGSEITINGNAFSPGSAIKIKYDSAETASAAADSNGSFSTVLKIPASKGGPHNITVSDGTTSTISIFNVETLPPAAPILTMPLNGDKSEPLAEFQWNSVTDPSSPVTYTLQIALDASFTSLFFEKTRLTTNSYLLTEQQKLKPSGRDKPYYWRVKAIDAASNESEWSIARNFNVGTNLPGWLWIVVCVLGGILLIILGFFAGKKWSRGFTFELPGFVTRLFRRHRRE